MLTWNTAKVFDGLTEPFSASLFDPAMVFAVDSNVDGDPDDGSLLSPRLDPDGAGTSDAAAMAGATDVGVIPTLDGVVPVAPMVVVDPPDMPDDDAGTGVIKVAVGAEVDVDILTASGVPAATEGSVASVTAVFLTVGSVESAEIPTIPPAPAAAGGVEVAEVLAAPIEEFVAVDDADVEADASPMAPPLGGGVEDVVTFAASAVPAVDGLDPSPTLLSSPFTSTLDSTITNFQDRTSTRMMKFKMRSSMIFMGAEDDANASKEDRGRLLGVIDATDDDEESDLLDEEEEESGFLDIESGVLDAIDVREAGEEDVCACNCIVGVDELGNSADGVDDVEVVCGRF